MYDDLPTTPTPRKGSDFPPPPPPELIENKISTDGSEESFEDINNSIDNIISEVSEFPPPGLDIQPPPLLPGLDIQPPPLPPGLDIQPPPLPPGLDIQPPPLPPLLDILPPPLPPCLDFHPPPLPPGLVFLSPPLPPISFFQQSFPHSFLCSNLSPTFPFSSFN